ncbi:MAG: Clp protease N-terminal domain-containing protein [Candidatus Dormibacteria bacterium]
MYPFERFTEKAKKVLTLAQEEAEKSHHSYIGTEHLLLGLLREGEGLAATVLANLGVEIDEVRDTIDSVLGRNERIVVQQIIPTSRMKKVIEIAFEEAKRMNNTHVGTEHLLLGLLVEGKGVAAHVLEDLGANLVKVRHQLHILLKERGPEQHSPGEAESTRPSGPRRREPGHIVQSIFRDLGPFTIAARSAMALTEEESAKAALGYVGTEHLLIGLLRQAEGIGARALNNLGVTLDRVRQEIAARRRSGRLLEDRKEPSRRFLAALTSHQPQVGDDRPSRWLDTQDILLAITADGDDPTAQLLDALGANATAVEGEVRRLEADSTDSHSLGPRIQSKPSLSFATLEPGAISHGPVNTE